MSATLLIDNLYFVTADDVKQKTDVAFIARRDVLAAIRAPQALHQIRRGSS
jgi:hypothetical protein